MATSSITTYSSTAQQLIDGAFSKLNLQVSGTSDATMSASALIDLNLMLKTWNAMPHLWLVARGSQALTASQASYTLTQGVRKVLRAQRRTGGTDLPLTELSAQEYDDLPSKAQTGSPLNFYQDRQRGAVTVYLWNVPDATAAASTTLQYTYARQIEVFTDLSQTADLPEEWQEAIVYNLAERLIPTYGADQQTEADIRARAPVLLAQLSGADQEQSSIFFQPASRFG